MKEKKRLELKTPRTIGCDIVAPNNHIGCDIVAPNMKSKFWRDYANSFKFKTHWVRDLSHLKVLGATSVAPNSIRCDIIILGATLIALIIGENFNRLEDYLVRHVAPNMCLGATFRCDMSHLILFRT